MVYTGTSDEVIEVEKPEKGKICFMHIEGNAVDRYFGVIAYDANGERLQGYVNTTNPYNGTRILDVRDGDETAMLEIEAEGPWTVVLQPVTPEHIQPRLMQSPGERSGIGDEVLVVRGSPKVITGVHNGDSNFIVRAYGDTSRVVFNEIGPYDGKSVLPAGVVAIEVLTEGQWTIALE